MSETHNRIQRDDQKAKDIFLLGMVAVGGRHTVGTFKRKRLAANIEKKERSAKVVGEPDYCTVQYKLTQGHLKNQGVTLCEMLKEEIEKSRKFFLLSFMYSCLHFPLTTPPAPPTPTFHPRFYPLWLCPCVLYIGSLKKFLSTVLHPFDHLKLESHYNNLYQCRI